VEKQVVIIWAATSGLLDDIETSKIAEFEAGLYRHLESGYEDVLPTIRNDKVLSDETIATLEKAVAEFKRQGGYGTTDDGAAPTDAKADAPKAEADAPKAETEAGEADAAQPDAEREADAARDQD
jgi:F-type H+-transporting ATPase subunit alpha